MARLGLLYFALLLGQDVKLFALAELPMFARKIEVAEFERMGVDFVERVFAELA
jgi:hypothetical protein